MQSQFWLFFIDTLQQQILCAFFFISNFSVLFCWLWFHWICFSSSAGDDTWLSLPLSQFHCLFVFWSVFIHFWTEKVALSLSSPLAFTWLCTLIFALSFHPKSNSLTFRNYEFTPPKKIDSLCFLLTRFSFIFLAHFSCTLSQNSRNILSSEIE